MNDNDLANILAKVIVCTAEAVEDAEKSVRSFDGSNQGLQDVNLILNSFGKKIALSHQILQGISHLQKLPDEIESLVNQLENIT